MLSVFNVAEKPSVANNITEILSNGRKNREFTHSRMNPVFSFQYYIESRMCKMYFTSVRGHLMGLDFEPNYRNWSRTAIEDLFTGKFHTSTHSADDFIGKQRLEGNRKEYIALRTLSRSKCAGSDIEHALNNLKEPNRNLANVSIKSEYGAVETRQEIDLRIGKCAQKTVELGSSITRFLTLKYKNAIRTQAKILSYGTCQLPTLGFVVERYLQIENFQREPYWTINVNVTHESIPVTFLWSRKKLFDEYNRALITMCRLAVLTLYEVCLENPRGVIRKIIKKEVKKHPPLPLDTIEMNKDVSKFLRISSHKCMQLAEALYNKGYISYPRTETNCFPSSINVKTIIRMLSTVQEFSGYANTLLNGGFREPIKGRKNDEAHPPIHPVKCLSRYEADSEEHWQLYEYIARRFLACCSKASIGHQSIVILDVSGEMFNLKGLIIHERNWLNIYTYSTWEGKLIPNFHENQQIMPDAILLKDGRTTPPSLLSEANLIDLMNRNGIGTDATMHEHIQKIQDRHYCVKDQNLRFIPTNLGKAIYHGFKEYNYRNIDLTKPILRAKMEKDMSDISVGIKDKNQVIVKYSNIMKSIFQMISNYSGRFDHFIGGLSRNLPDEAPLPNVY
ncbi:DNA topoisomerase III [Theileria orientalis strain Shintoku]|uniref:DNA topoisomerase n=1 Tax=Theileria orientalis strain Shintoku TaxID=869250 RepID=J4CDC9_THEOR|nr:DNA topoisomerase III [Theileria orientalis strain Shintoku]BAM40922.1 DNA topoisomerase III [Theileria orientalis strain Shintoku]|eukprot:XP_009691223.1 DNA topoisomerase III [Theileria orientalis strain Shintoku]